MPGSIQGSRPRCPEPEHVAPADGGPPSKPADRTAGRSPPQSHRRPLPQASRPGTGGRWSSRRRDRLRPRPKPHAESPAPPGRPDSRLRPSARDGSAVVSLSATKADADAVDALDGLNVVYYTELSEAEQRRMKARIDSRRSLPARSSSAWPRRRFWESLRTRSTSASDLSPGAGAAPRTARRLARRGCAGGLRQETRHDCYGACRRRRRHGLRPSGPSTVPVIVGASFSWAWA